MTANRVNLEDIKTLIKLAATTEEADSFVIEFTGRETIKEKFEFVTKLFDAQIIGRGLADNTTIPEADQLTDDYEAVLNAIINIKWR